MQILPKLSLTRAGFNEVRQTLDGYIARIVLAANHNAKEREFTRRTRTPVNARSYDIEVIHVPRKIVAVNAIMLVGSCDLIITHGTTDIVWKDAGGTTLSLSTTMLSDTVESDGDVPADTRVYCTASNVAGSPENMILTLRTGS